MAAQVCCAWFYRSNKCLDLNRAPINLQLQTERLRQRKIRNSTGATLHYTHTNGTLQAVVSGEEAELFVQTQMPQGGAQFDSKFKQLGIEYSLKVQLDGSWEPHLKVSSAEGFWIKQTLCSYTGPGYEKITPKYVDIICETREEVLPGSASSASLAQQLSTNDGAVDGAIRGSDRPPIVLELHSTVQIINETADVIEAYEDSLAPGAKTWLPLMVVATGAIAIRPSSQFTWSLPFRFKTFASREEKKSDADQPVNDTDIQPSKEITASSSEQGDRSYISYAPAECVHLKTDQVWCYSVKVLHVSSIHLSHIRR